MEYGIPRRQIPGPLRALEALGIVVVMHGRGGNADYHVPNRFLLNYLCGAVNTRDEITNTWKRIKTMEQASQIARSARAAKDENRVARSRQIAGQKNIFQVPHRYHRWCVFQVPYRYHHARYRTGTTYRYVGWGWGM
jgi:hypothetical protein